MGEALFENGGEFFRGAAPDLAGWQDETDGHAVAGERNKPEPAAGGAHDGNVALGFAFVAGGAFEVCVDGDATCLLRDASAQTGAGSSEGAAPAGVHDPTRAHFAGPVRTFDLQGHLLRVGIGERSDAGFLVHGAAVFLRVAEEKLVERSAFHLVREFVPRGEVVAEPQPVAAPAVGGGEFRAVFAEEPGGFEFLPDADFLEEVIAVREEGFADGKAGKFFLLEDRDAESGLGETRSGGTARRAAADDGDVAGLGGRRHGEGGAARR